MKFQAYRIVKAAFADSAFDGEGAREFGGRWNSPGVAMIYASATLSLAMLEMLVHLQTPHLLLSYVFFPLLFDASLVTQIELASLPPDWRSSPAPPPLQQLGDDWVYGGDSAVLSVPSAVVAEEMNYMLNPHHRDFARITIGDVQPIQFDPRLK